MLWRCLNNSRQSGRTGSVVAGWTWSMSLRRLPTNSSSEASSTASGTVGTDGVVRDERRRCCDEKSCQIAGRFASSSSSWWPVEVGRIWSLPVGCRSSDGRTDWLCCCCGHASVTVEAQKQVTETFKRRSLRAENAVAVVEKLPERMGTAASPLLKCLRRIVNSALRTIFRQTRTRFQNFAYRPTISKFVREVIPQSDPGHCRNAPSCA